MNDTMKTLLLFRHAKASRDDAGVPDHERTLKSSGKKDAKQMGRLLREANLVPTLIVSSTAVRARKTASKAAKQMDYPRAIELSERLYLSTPRDYLEVVHSVQDTEDRVMLVGHNPGISQFLSELTDTATELSTAEVAQIELPIKHWADLAASDAGKLVKLWQPDKAN
jgi:phosphohistidine phosphatase